MLQRNVELAQAQRTIAELAVKAERSRFARDLHDILGHSLTVLTVKAELAGRLVALDPERAEREIGEVEALARQALADVRAAVAGYREVSLPGELASARAALEAAGIVADRCRGPSTTSRPSAATSSRGRSGRASRTSSGTAARGTPGCG